MDKDNRFLEVRIITPKQTLFQGQAVSVSSINSQGKFDILIQHANFITLVENQPIDIKLPNNQVLNYKFSQAIIYNYENKLSIFAEPLSA